MSRIVLLPLLIAVATAAPALAQSPAQQPGLGGNPVPGVCLLSREAIFSNAKIGVAASARLKQIADQEQAEIDAERKPVEAEVQAFQNEAAKLTPEQRQTRERALSAKLVPIQAKAQQRSREVEATRAKAMERISTEAQPVIAQVYTAKACGLLIDRNSVLGGNLVNDLTPAVVQALDAKISAITFNRETLPAQIAASAAR